MIYCHSGVITTTRLGILLLLHILGSCHRIFLLGTVAFSPASPSTRHHAHPATRKKSYPAQRLALTSSFSSLSHGEEALLLGLKKLHRRIQNPTALDTKRASLVEWKPSSIVGAGDGLFVKKNIPAGTIVTYYPAHRLGVEYDNDGNEENVISMTMDEEDKKYFDRAPKGDSKSSGNYLHFLMGKRPLYRADGMTTQAFEGGALFVDVNPNQPLIDGWMGHLVNDGATVASSSEQSLLNYYAATRAAKNCVHVPFGPSPIQATVTTRKVKKGQELFTTYGCSYWMDALMGSAGMDAVEISPAIQDEVKETARDIFLALQGVNARRQAEAMELQASFDSLFAEE